jgi:TRAP-type mannitol/chloroaromatic compound transport system substrate-binding protein
MKFKRAITLSLSLAIAMGAVACTKKEVTQPPTTPPKTESTSLDPNYVKKYSKSYEDYIVGIKDYQIYSTPESINEYYKTNEYPGNEVHLTNIKNAYKESKTKIQSFIDVLKNDAKTKDTELEKMNNELIAEGEQAIKNIDARMAKLDKLPADTIDKPKEEFMKLVDETIVIKDETQSKFKQFLDNMNEKLGITNKK